MNKAVTATLACGADVVVSSIVKLKTSVHYNHLIIRNSLGNVCMGMALLRDETESALEGAQTAGCKATVWILPMVREVSCLPYGFLVPATNGNQGSLSRLGFLYS